VGVGDAAGEGDAFTDGFIILSAGEGDGEGDDCASAACVPASANITNAASEWSFFKIFPSDKFNSTHDHRLPCRRRERTGRLNVPGVSQKQQRGRATRAKS
jgi:hypothetical protein